MPSVPPPIQYDRTNQLVDWKGPTFHQIAPTTIYNNPSEETIAPNNFLRALPLKHYRRDIPGINGNNDGNYNGNCVNNLLYHNPGRIRELYQPGGTQVNSSETQYRQDTIAPILPPSEICSAGSVCLSAQANARRRARSSGMIRKTTATTPNYYTTAGQRLYGRNKTYEQNQITQFRQGDASIIPGAPGSYDNVYASGTAVNCPGTTPGNSSVTSTTYIPVYYKPSNPRFAHQGAVSANERMFRLKYDTVTNGGQVTNTSFGLLRPSALAYYVNGDVYRLKDKIGVPAPLVPTFSLDSSEMKTCASSRFH
jgi:hypothetical protein